MAFQGSLKELPLPDIIQLVSVSGKTGMFALKNGAESGSIFLRKGQIVHAKLPGPLECAQAMLVNAGCAVGREFGIAIVLIVTQLGCVEKRRPLV